MSRTKNFNKIDGVYWKSFVITKKQSVVMFFEKMKDNTDNPYYNIGLAIGKNRKQCLSWYFDNGNYLDNKISGKSNPFEVKKFAMDTLQEFEQFLFNRKEYVYIIVGAADERRQKLYNKVLLLNTAN